MCEDHSSQKLEFFCKDCTKLVCSHCVICFHQGHGVITKKQRVSVNMFYILAGTNKTECKLRYWKYIKNTVKVCFYYCLLQAYKEKSPAVSIIWYSVISVLLNIGRLGVVTAQWKLLAFGWMSRVDLLSRWRTFSVYHLFQTGSGTSPLSYTMGTWDEVAEAWFWSLSFVKVPVLLVHAASHPFYISVVLVLCISTKKVVWKFWQ